MTIGFFQYLFVGMGEDEAGQREGEFLEYSCSACMQQSMFSFFNTSSVLPANVYQAARKIGKSRLFLGFVILSGSVCRCMSDLCSMTM